MMKHYLLLRDNRQSGPWSIEELRSIMLRPLDLVWIEGESTSWQYAEELEALKPLIHDSSSNSDPLTIEAPSVRQYNGEIEKFFPPENDPAARQRTVSSQVEEFFDGSLDKPVWRKRSGKAYGISSIAAVTIGVMFGAIVIKKLVDGYVADESAQKALAMPVIERQPQQNAGEDFKNALLTEIVPLYKSQVAKTSQKEKITKVERQLKLKAGKYKVGLFGGINGFQLTVFNTSSRYIDKALVSVDYLRPNGAVIQSENILFSSIKPKEAQTISIPGSKRGVKVQYKILKVFAHDYKAELKHV